MATIDELMKDRFGGEIVVVHPTWEKNVSFIPHFKVDDMWHGYIHYRWGGKIHTKVSDKDDKFRLKVTRWLWVYYNYASGFWEQTVKYMTEREARKRLLNPRKVETSELDLLIP